MVIARLEKYFSVHEARAALPFARTNTYTYGLAIICIDQPPGCL